MPNRYHRPMNTGAGSAKTDSRGSKASATVKEKVSYPGVSLPGKGGPDRAGGTPKSGKMGSFHVDKKGFC